MMRSSPRPSRRSPPSPRANRPSPSAERQQADSRRRDGRDLGRGSVSARSYARRVSAPTETAALIALLRAARRPWNLYTRKVETACAARQILDDEHGLLADELLHAASKQLEWWEHEGIRVHTVL